MGGGGGLLQGRIKSNRVRRRLWYHGAQMEELVLQRKVLGKIRNNYRRRERQLLGGILRTPGEN